MKRLPALIFALLIHINLYAQEVQTITDPRELSILRKKMNTELLDSLKIIKGLPVLENHLTDLINKINTGEVRIEFQKGETRTRGSQQSVESCNCSVIKLSSKYIDSGVVSTLMHEFEHVKQDLLINKLVKVNPAIDKLTDIFGEYYYGKNDSLKSDPYFNQALFVGSALVFYMEYDAFKMQINSINAGIKDKVRPEKNKTDIMNTVANDYLINHDIVVDDKYIVKLASLADQMPIDDFILYVGRNKAILDYFIKMQKNNKPLR